MYQHWNRQEIQDQYYTSEQNAVINRQKSVQSEDQRRDNIYLCPTEGCNRYFSWKNNLTWHLRHSCGIEPRYKCPYCDYKCKVKGDIRKHILRIHKDSEIYVIDLFKKT